MVTRPQGAFVAAACWLACLSGAVGCTQPRPLDAGLDPDVPPLSDVPRLDVPAALDTPSALDGSDSTDTSLDAPLVLADVPSDVPSDAPVDTGRDAPSDAGPRCDALWGAEPGYQLCGETATTCDVRVELLGRSCDAVCTARGGTCVVVHNDGFLDVCMGDPRDLPCSTTGMSYICTCRLP